MEEKKILASLVRFFHQLIVYFFVIGAFLPSKYLIYYILMNTGQRQQLMDLDDQDDQEEIFNEDMGTTYEYF